MFCMMSGSRQPRFRRGHSLLNRSRCELGEFKLARMDKCRPLLTCDDMEDLTVGRRIGGGAVKNVSDKSHVVG